MYLTEKSEKGQLRLVGLKLTGKTTNVKNQSSTDCGNLWQKFESEKVSKIIRNKISEEIYAVYYDYESDETGPFSYFIGCRVDNNSQIQKGLSELIIPSQSYMKVVAKGKMPVCISEAWTSIWNSKMKRKFEYDFEVYDDRSKDWNDAEVDIFISIDDKK